MNYLTRTLAAAIALGAVVVASACNSLDDVPPATGVTKVRVEDNRFAPRAIEVPAGTEVTWDFAGRSDHNVISNGWGSEVMRDGTFAHRFDEPGTFDYSCTLHFGMNGRVLVTDAPEE